MCVGEYHHWSEISITEYLKKSAPKFDDIDFLKNRKTGEKFRLTTKIGTIWSNIGLRLGIESDFLDSIMDEERTNERRLRRVLQTWLSNAGQLPNHEDYPLSWQGLRNILDDCEKEEIAKEYFEFLSAM